MQLEKLFDLLPHETPPRGCGSRALSFGSGAYAKGGLQGLRKECGTFPQAAQLVNRFIAHVFPNHKFTSHMFFCNAQTDMHIDSHNYHSPNAVIAISSFSGGHVWVGDDKGSVYRKVKDHWLKGTLHDVAKTPLLFDAWRLPHCTENWTGRRLVLVAFSVADTSRMPADALKTLLALGFKLPDPLRFGLPSKRTTQPPLQASSPQPWVFELFSGRASLSRALWQAGFQVLSLDSGINQAASPTAKLDLASEDGQSLLWDLLSKFDPFALHLGVPCGTASRAREKPLPKHALCGRPSPQPLRSRDHPLGLPGLTGLDAQRVRSANALYKFAYRLILHCVRRQIVITLENPINSYLWQILELFASLDGVPWPPTELEEVLFHVCCHGGTRPKHTKLLATRNVCASLRAACDNSHVHEPWGLVFLRGSSTFSTASEAAYPALLAKRWADCFAREATTRGLPLQVPTSLHAESLASVGRQTRKFLPLIPEFSRVSYLPASFQPDKSCKILLSHGQGGVSGGEKTQVNAEDGDRRSRSPPKLKSSASTFGYPSAGGAPETLGPVGCSGGDVKVGFWLTPEEHVSKALKLQHPVDTANPVSDHTKAVLEEYMSDGAPDFQSHRKLALLKVKLLVRTLEGEESKLHDTFPAWYQKVVAHKKILAWKKLLEDNHYDDMAVTDFMLKGCPLVGTSDKPLAFDAKVVPAVMTESELRATAEARRQAMKLSKQTMDQEHLEHLKAATQEEVTRGFLEGPLSEEQVTRAVGHSSWSAVRRFVLVQGAELKLRPIDDCHEAQLNDAYSSTIKLKMMDSDYVTALALMISRMEVARAKKLGVPARPWAGKTLDLTKAYKQLPVLPAHRDLCVIYVKGADGSDCYYIANALVFGATSAVYCFNRVARSLWFLMTKVLKIPCGFFYDDYPLFCLEAEGSMLDSQVSEFLSLLGWDHATSGSKGLPFDSVFTVLGMQLDLSRITDSTVVLANKPGRLERIVDRFKLVQTSGAISKHEAQVLRGLLQFASGFFAGRGLRQTCCWLGSVIQGVRFGPSEISSMAEHAINVLASSTPRFLSAGPADPVLHLYTDGSWEKGIAGVGAVLIDAGTGVGRVFQGTVDPSLIGTWLSSVGEQLICEIELYALVAVRYQLGSLFEGRRCIYWIDNNAARGTVIKGWSRSPAMHDLALRLAEAEGLTPGMSWIERVPSFSNVADFPSRGEGSKVLKLAAASCVEPFPQDDEFIRSVRASKS